AGAVDALAAGETLSDTFTVKVADNHGGFASQDVKITITGTKDATANTSTPETVAACVPDDGWSKSATGQVTFSDVDTRDTHVFSLSSAAAYGSASVDQDFPRRRSSGLAGAVDALAAGETLSDTFTVKVADSHGGFASQDVKITITGTKIGRASCREREKGAVAEGAVGGSKSASGQVTISDVEASDAHRVALSSAAGYHSATDGQYSTWHCSASHAGAVDALAAGETLSDTFTVKVADSHGGFASQDVKITITGT